MSGFHGSSRRSLAVSLLAAIALFDIACGRGPEPTLAGLNGLLAARKFDDAERQIDAFLAARPDDVQANLLSAQIALNREPQQPRLALERLGRIGKAERPTLAVVRLNEGKAHSALGDTAKAEASWLEALRLDPLVPEAGWALLSLYYVEGRRAEAERLGLALHGVEPDPRDRVQLLLELVRQDAKPIVPLEIIRVLEPVGRELPDDLHTTIALARAYYGDSRHDECIALLNRLVDRYPGDPAAWEALLRNLDDAARPEEFAAAFARLPAALAKQPRFARYAGIVAQSRRDWASSVIALERARKFDPLDAQVAYRLGRGYRLAGREPEAKKLEGEFRDIEAALREMLSLYNEANAIRGLGVDPSPDLYLKIAEARERLGYRAEALAWFRLAIRDRPDDPAALAATQRLADAKLPTFSEVLAEAEREASTR